MRFSDLDPATRARLIREGRVPGDVTRHPKKRRGPTPEDLLWSAVVSEWPGARREYTPAPDRRYRLDIALVEDRLAIEVDGYQHHGKYLRDFRRDRERQNWLVVRGWRVLRFAAGDIRSDIEACLTTIRAALESTAQDNDPWEGFQPPSGTTTEIRDAATAIRKQVQQQRRVLDRAFSARNR